MAQDPCDQRYVGGGSDHTTRHANCVAAGINPDTFISNAVNQTIPITTSGNPALVPEESKSFTYGVVIQPRWFPRATVTLDYFHIDIENRISPLTLTEILDACYDSKSYPKVTGPMAEDAMPVSAAGSGSPKIPSTPPSAITNGNTIGSSQMAGARNNAPHSPTATIATTWSSPNAGCASPARNPPASPEWASAGVTVRGSCPGHDRHRTR